MEAGVGRKKEGPDGGIEVASDPEVQRAGSAALPNRDRFLEEGGEDAAR
jgi:hypothetical protein